jgi:Arc/MetJ-type ribon-helix-helix transcriptional regulator
MPVTLNISLSEEQKGWLNTRRDTGGFSSSSDVVRALIRDAQEREQTALLNEFRDLEGDGSNAPEPAAEVLRLVKQVKKSRRAKAACHS